MKKRSRAKLSDKNKEVTLPARFTPQFWCDADGRIATIKEIRRRYKALKQDTQADSYQKDLLCQRCVFIACQLETMELVAVEKGEFNAGTYTQMVNCFIGLLKSLGLERKAKQVTNLREYVKKHKKKRNY